MIRGRVGWVIALLLAALLPALSTAAYAQAVVTGKVATEAGTPIGQAGVYVRQLGLGTTTNDSGMYRLTIPAAQAATQIVIAVRRIGFVPQERAFTATGAAHTENFTLKADPLHLDQMVTTGVADSTSTRNLSFSVAHVSSDQVSSVPASNPLEALAGKVAGAKIEVGVGNPGAAPAIRLRGSTSLQVGQSTPLIIVDGVLTTESIADFDALDIESVEVLKGAAGASFYGSNAANGVINITTKRGKSLAENHISITARTEYGKSGIGHWPSVNHGTRMQFTPNGAIQLDSTGAPVLNASGFDDTPYPSSGPNMFRNQLQTWMQNNDYYNNDISLGLRRGNTNFSSMFSSNHNGGILPFKNGQFKQNARLNVDQGLGAKADLSASVTYGNQRNDYNEGSSQAWFALYQAPPFLDLTHPNPIDSTTLYYPVLPTYTSNARGNPLYDLYTNTTSERRERILGSVAGHYRPYNWLRLDATYGTDRLNSRQRNYTARGTLSSTSGQPGSGSLHDYTTNDVSWNSQTRATATKLFGNLLSTTSLAYQLESETDNSFDAGGSRLYVNAVPDLGAINSDAITIGSTYVEQRTTDYMASQSFTFKDRYIFDGLYRRDGSSLFGPDSRWSDFYRVAGAYRLTQDFNIPGVQELKLHAARGTAGLRPQWYYQYETYGLSGGGTLTKSTLGNKNLRPAVLTENEYGLNVDFLQRFSGELTYADRRTRDAFLQVPLSLAASGGFQTQWQNAATIQSKTIEGSLQAHVLDRGRFTWDVTVTGDHTTQGIVNMIRAPFRVAADNSQGQAVFWYEAGKPLGIIYGQRYVHNFQQLKDNPANGSAVESDYVVNPLGYLVKKTARGTRAERPITYVDKSGNSNFVIGDVNPDLNFGISNDFRVGSFDVHANFDGQRGGDIYNFSKQWTFQDLRSGDMDMTKKSAADKIAEDFYSAGLYNGLNPSEYFVEDGTYLKLRELSVAYNVAQKYLPKIGLGRAAGLKVAFIGRNLLTWTNYSGFDPDVTSGSDFNYRIDGFKYPPFRTLTGQVEIQF